MIVVALASILPAFLIGAAIFFALRHVASPTFSVAAASIAAFAFAVFSSSPTLNWIVEKSTNTRLNTDSEIALKVMGTPKLPADTISDFCYQTSFRSSSPIADFKMSQPDFLKWMSAEGWEAQEFNSETGHVDLKGSNLTTETAGSITTAVYPLRSGAGQQEHLVTSGNLVYRRSGDSIRTFIYDLGSERVYFSHSIY